VGKKFTFDFEFFGFIGLKFFLDCVIEIFLNYAT